MPPRITGKVGAKFENTIKLKLFTYRGYETTLWGKDHNWIWRDILTSVRLISVRILEGEVSTWLKHYEIPALVLYDFKYHAVLLTLLFSQTLITSYNECSISFWVWICNLGQIFADVKFQRRQPTLKSQICLI